MCSKLWCFKSVKRKKLIPVAVYGILQKQRIDEDVSCITCYYNVQYITFKGLVIIKVGLFSY